MLVPTFILVPPVSGRLLYIFSLSANPRVREIQPVEISPTEYEKQVVEWLKASTPGSPEVDVRHLERVQGAGGEYEIDAVVEMEILGGSRLVILVECKRYRSPVKRDVVMVLEAKLRDAAAHKGIVFSTSGFQSGALEYAASRGIATVTLQDGRTSYHTRAHGQQATPPPWVHISKFIGWFARPTEHGASYSLIDDDRCDPLRDWISEHEDV